MPRRRVFTDAQLESLIALPRTEPVLVRHWSLDEADLAAIARRRGGGNRFGYALQQLCAFRYPGRLLRPGEVLPQPALDFVAEQIHVTPGELAIPNVAARKLYAFSPAATWPTLDPFIFIGGRIDEALIVAPPNGTTSSVWRPPSGPAPSSPR